MEKKVKKILSSKTPTGTIYRLTLPVEWLREREVPGADGVDDVLMEFDKEKKIIIVRKIEL